MCTCGCRLAGSTPFRGFGSCVGGPIRTPPPVPVLWNVYLDVAGTKAGEDQGHTLRERTARPPSSPPARHFVVRVTEGSLWKRTCMSDRLALSVRSPVLHEIPHGYMGETWLRCELPSTDGRVSEEGFLGGGSVTGTLTTHILRGSDAPPVGCLDAQIPLNVVRAFRAPTIYRALGI